MMGDYSIHNELTADQFDQLHTLTKKMWWSTDRTREDIVTMIKLCIPFAVIDNNTQHLVGFARVLTDGIRYAYIYDLMTEEDLRGIGIGKLIMQTILLHPALSQVKYFELTCAPNMINYYTKFGFTDSYGNVVAMRLVSDPASPFFLNYAALT
jgi:predicted GNAT family N-acyltransferase